MHRADPRARSGYLHRIFGILATAAPGAVATTMAAAILLSGSCLFGTKTNLCELSGRRCNPGQVCAANQDVCVEIGGCGDGVVSAAEVCDDGNLLEGDGCSANCSSNETCGNGELDLAESCDDGNRIGGDGCSPDCAAEVCGNRIVDDDLGEVCDDGNTTPNDGCSASCKSNEACGNGFIDESLGETCDPTPLYPKPAQDTAGCDSDCSAPQCGDGHTNPEYDVTDAGPIHREQCDTGERGVRKDTLGCDSDCTFTVCGDNHLNEAAGEQCDEGPDNSSLPDRTCRKDCKVASCGDGIEDATSDRQEECDDGNSNTHDGCPDGPQGTCKPATCGDGLVHNQAPGVEQCDDGAGNSNTKPDACRSDCTTPRCGDGIKDPLHDEVCDGNSGCTGQQQCTSDCKQCVGG